MANGTARTRRDSCEDRTSSSHSTSALATTTTTSTDSNKLSRKFTVQAAYSYEACENDELSFKQGDIILDCEYVDQGWMIGTHAKTKLCGMLPSNYVIQLL
ncbi:hypothetical protein ACOME3_005901 [Neoechinorhynchus agilis]